MTRFYTRRGDDGFTRLLGKGRVPKYSTRIEAVGTLDEAMAVLGLARANCFSDRTQEVIRVVQCDLFHLMAEAACTTEKAPEYRKIDSARVAWLETQIEDLEAVVTVPEEFIVPGDSSGGAHMAQARTVIRRAERRIARLLSEDEIENQELLRYLNRLSSLCFILELLENQAAGKTTTLLGKRLR